MDVHEGDFMEDEFPEGYDAIMFSRVLTDWTPSVCKMLFEKVRRPLQPDGKLVITEAFVDGVFMTGEDIAAKSSVPLRELFQYIAK